jgi:hypothetical protein
MQGIGSAPSSRATLERPSATVDAADCISPYDTSWVSGYPLTASQLGELTDQTSLSARRKLERVPETPKPVMNVASNPALATNLAVSPS